MRLREVVAIRRHPERLGDAVAPGLRQAAARIAPLLGNQLLVPVVLRGREHEIAGPAFVLFALRSTDRVRQEPGFTAQHVVIVLAALAAELDRRHQPPACGLQLSFERELALRRRFDRRVERAPLADELVQLEGERSATVIALELPAQAQQFAQPFAASLFRNAASLR